MNNTAKQLADALRALFDSPREGQMGEGTKLLCGELNLDEARLALAAYDAQQAHTDEIVLPPEPPCDEQTAPNYGIIDDAYSFDALEAYARAAVELDRSRRA